MARSGSGIKLTNSRFACLQLEEEEEEQKKARRNQRNKEQQNQRIESANPKKKDDKKKKKDVDELRQMAFGKPISAGGKKKGGKNANGNNAKNPTEAEWSDWIQRDKEVVEDQFKDDLEKALLESRLQMEQKKSEDTQKEQRIEAGIEVPATKDGKKKKKQKEKAKPMSLQEFKQLPVPTSKAPHSDDSDVEPSPPPVHYSVPPTEQDTKFFNNVQNDARQILRQDKIQEDYRKTYAADNAVVAKLKNDIELRDNTIAELRGQVETMDVEMKQVKQRNKQLCLILAQGEMKDKARVLIQVDELNAVKDELMEQVTTLTAALEKEKSKSSALKSESDKKKGSKQGK